MQCPFCQCANDGAAGACRVCGGPLRTKPAPNLSPVPFVATIAAPVLVARQTLDENAAPLVCLGFVTGDSSSVVVMRQNGEARVWNAQNDDVASFCIGRWFRKTSPLVCAAIAPNFLVTACSNGEVRLHTLKGSEARKPAAHLGCVLALATTEAHFYSGGSDGVIWQTPLPDESNKARRNSHAIIEGLGAMTTFAVAPDGTLLAVGRDDGAVQLFRPNAEHTTAKLDWTRSKHAAPVASMAFSPNGQMLLSRDKDGGLCLWAAQTSYQLPLPSLAQRSRIAPAFSADNRYLALANADDKILIFDVAMGTLLHELPALADKVSCLAFSTENALLAVADARELAVWEIL